MREILFRGKRKDNGEWVYGYYVHYDDVKNNGKDDCDYIVQKHNGEYFPSVEVIPETVGQHTELEDKKGKSVYEGDRLLVIWSDQLGEPHSDIIIVDSITNYNLMAHLDYANELKVIGNIHDNPNMEVVK